MHKRSYITGHEDHPHFINDSAIKKLKKTFSNTDQHHDALLILKNLSDPTKLNIYLLLHEVNEIPVTDIGYVLGLSQSAVSHALSDLKKLDLVECSRCGQLMCYSLKRQPQQRSSLLSIFNKFFFKGGLHE